MANFSGHIKGNMAGAIHLADLCGRSYLGKQNIIHKGVSQVNKALNNGDIDERTANSRKSNLYGMYQQFKEERGNGTNIMYNLGLGARALYDNLTQNARNANLRNQGAGDRIRQSLLQNDYTTRGYLAQFAAERLQNSAPVTAGVGTGFGGMSQFPIGGMSGMQPFQMGNMGGMSPTPMGMNIIQNAIQMINNHYQQMMAQMMAQMGAMNQHAGFLGGHPNSGHFAPNMQNGSDPKEASTITLGGVPYNIPKQTGDKLEKIKNNFEDSDSMSEQQKYLNAAAQLIIHDKARITNSTNKGNRRNSSPMSLKYWDDNNLREFARSYLKSGMAESDLDIQRQGLEDIGIASPRDIADLEDYISADNINTYEKLFDRYANDDDLSLKYALRRRSGEEEIRDDIARTLGSIEDQEGLNSKQFEILDRIIKSCKEKGISTEIAFTNISDAVGGVTSHKKEKNLLIQKEDNVKVIPTKSKKGTVSGHIPSTSKYPSYINTAFGNKSEFGNIELELDSVKLDENSNWTGIIRFTDSNGKTVDYDLGENNDRLPEEFSDAFEEIYEGFIPQDGKPIGNLPGHIKFKLAQLENVLKHANLDPAQGRFRRNVPYERESEMLRSDGE